MKHKPTSHLGEPPARTQASLFDCLPASAPAAGPALLAIPVPAAAQNKAQRVFNKLIDQIRQ